MNNGKNGNKNSNNHDFNFNYDWANYHYNNKSFYPNIVLFKLIK